MFANTKHFDDQNYGFYAQKSNLGFVPVQMNKNYTVKPSKFQSVAQNFYSSKSNIIKDNSNIDHFESLTKMEPVSNLEASHFKNELEEYCMDIIEIGDKSQKNLQKENIQKNSTTKIEEDFSWLDSSEDSGSEDYSFDMDEKDLLEIKKKVKKDFLENMCYNQNEDVNKTCVKNSVLNEAQVKDICESDSSNKDSENSILNEKNLTKKQLYNLRYYKKNKGKLQKITKEKKKKYYTDNSDVIKAKSRAYKNANKEALREYEKEYYLKNKENSENSKDDPQNREKKKEIRKAYYDRNKDKLVKIKKEYYWQNRDKCKERNQTYYHNTVKKNKKVMLMKVKMLCAMLQCNKILKNNAILSKQDIVVQEVSAYDESKSQAVSERYEELEEKPQALLNLFKRMPKFLLRNQG